MSKEKAKIFPYEPRKKIVIFGGSTAWAKEMKRLLKNVDIINVDSKRTYKNLIEKAEVVWIHIFISHNYQGKILSIARKNKKDIKFLNKPGCQSSAKQVYDYEVHGIYDNYLLQ